MGLLTKQFPTNSTSRRRIEARKNQFYLLSILHRVMANTLGGVPPICGRKPGTKEYEVGRVRRTTLGLSFTSSLCSYCPIGRYSTTQSDREVT